VMQLKYLLLILTFVIAVECGAAAQNQDSLLIGPGDLLQLKVFDTPELDQSVRVTDAGTIPLIVGTNVQVSSVTAESAARNIESALRDGHFLLHPHVAVSIAELATQKISVLGEVKAPGAYTITTSRSVIDVLALAGGITDVADRRIVIERRATHERVPYFLSNTPDLALASAIYVNPGDSIVVPKAGIVYVLGDVARPGGYTMTNNDAQLTALQLLARAGGTNHSAVPSRAKLIHRSGNAYLEEPLPLSAMQKGKRPDVALEADDIVWVPFSYLRSFVAQGSGIVSALSSATVYKF
jgi:polysaccharide export outer membrane protein